MRFDPKPFNGLVKRFADFEAESKARLTASEGQIPDKVLFKSSKAYRDAYLYGLGRYDALNFYKPNPRYADEEMYRRGRDAGVARRG